MKTLTVPCIDCISYAICKAVYVNSYNNIRQNISNDIQMAKARVSVYDRCIMIVEWINGYGIWDKQIKALHNAMME